MQLLQLGFQNCALERRFMLLHNEAAKNRARLSSVIAAFFVIGFSPWDFYALGNDWFHAGSVRWALSMPACLLIGGVTYLKSYYKNSQIYLTITVTVGLISIGGIAYRLESPVGVGITSSIGAINYMLAIIYASLAFGLLWPGVLFSTLVGVISYFIFVSLASQADFIHHLVYGSNVIVGAVIGITTAVLYGNYEREIFQLQESLKLEKEKSDRLVMQIFPESIAERVKNGEKDIVESFSEATILFADIVGFTELSSKLSPKHILEIISSLFSDFDKLVDKYGLEKIKTIGDCYMAVCSVPTWHEGHADATLSMAIDMLDVVKKAEKYFRIPLNLRIGIHTGSVIGGVIGTKKPVYDIWGDAVNIAARIESSSLPGIIQISESTYLRLNKRDDFEMIENNLKGKGVLKMFRYKNPSSDIVNNNEYSNPIP